MQGWINNGDIGYVESLRPSITLSIVRSFPLPALTVVCFAEIALMRCTVRVLLLAALDLSNRNQQRKKTSFVYSSLLSLFNKTTKSSHKMPYRRRLCLSPTIKRSSQNRGVKKQISESKLRPQKRPIHHPGCSSQPM